MDFLNFLFGLFRKRRSLNDIYTKRRIYITKSLNEEIKKFKDKEYELQ